MQHGYVVLRNVFDAEQCRRTCDAMWAIAERANPGLRAADRRTWGAMKGSGKYGLSQRGPSFDPVLVANRQNPRLAACLAAVVGCPVPDLMVSQDRFTIYRATVDSDGDGVGVGVSEDGTANDTHGAQFATGRRNVHLDLNPWWWQEGSAEVVAGADTLRYDDAQDFIRENNMVVASMGTHVQVRVVGRCCCRCSPHGHSLCISTPVRA